MKIRSSGSSVPEINMTPMIDIVFQLIAFFMVITNFEQNQADERVRLPKDQLARPPEVKRDNSFTLNLGFLRDSQTGQITDPDPYLFFGPDRVNIRDCATRLRQEAQFYEALDVDLAEVTVEIRSDGDVSTGLVQELIQKCQEARASQQSTEGFQRFALRATQKTD
ncbi:MAG: biopolymer transporter ExbD [Fuerstiella sp.]|nr:biopolymer transporter ExbD [Fuerstiella sp.]